MALVDQVLDALAGTEGEMVLFPKCDHAGNGLSPPLALFIGRRGRGGFLLQAGALPQAFAAIPDVEKVQLVRALP